MNQYQISFMLKVFFYLTFDPYEFTPLYVQRDMKQKFYLIKNDNEITDCESTESDSKSERQNVYVVRR